MKLLLTLTLLLFLNACSVKEINATVDSVTSDIVNAFEDAKDKENN